MAADVSVPERADVRPAPVARWILREQRRSLVLWAVAVAAVSAMYMAFYPSMANQSMDDLMAGLPEPLREAMGWDVIATGAGYLQSTVYGLLAVALLLVFAVSRGAGLVAGEEEAGTLELEATAPVSRAALAGQRFATLALALLALCAVLAALTLALAPALDMGIPAGNVLAATAGLWLFVLAVGAVTFAVGAATGRKGAALGVGSALGIGSYMANAIGAATADFGWLQTVSPFSWYVRGDPLVNGADPGAYAALAVLTVAAFTASLAAFDRRDLGV